MFSSRPNKERRPTGVSRRRKKQFAFETLEDRRVMTASTPVALLAANSAQHLQLQTESYSSATAEGQLQQLINEMYWQSLINPTATSTLAPRSIPSDPMLANQWHLINSGQQVGNPDFQPIYGVPGQDINVAPVWNQNIFGSGVVVAIIDSGVQLDHPDLAGNLDTSLQFNANTGQSNGSPVNPGASPNESHGTAVAGLIGAVANNGIGGTGVAPGVTMVPITLISGLQSPFGITNAIRYAMNNGVDITNNSYGPPDDIRTLAGPTPQELLALRDSVIFGRNGLGQINVWAAGNGAGDYPTRPGFPGDGVFDSSNYDGYANSRYTIAVTGVDHDGSYNNVDGTVTGFMEAGANVLIAAPTGSATAAIQIADDVGIGSGITTTDLFNFINGEDVWGFNIPPDDVTGEEIDRDFLANTQYTSRFGGTSSSAPLVSGVIALMLEVNPNLTWRDVQEILVRSARQNDQFGVPSSGGGGATQSTWITNQVPLFVAPDLFDGQPVLDVYTPLLDPLSPLGLNATLDGRIYADNPVAQPFALTNGAGYTVSQGVGTYGEQIGYGHGVIDAALAVSMAQNWSSSSQSLPAELTFTTFVQTPGNVALDLPGAERGNEDSGFLIVPGGIGGLGGFIGWFNEYFADTPDFSDLTYDRGASSLMFSVPANNAMSIESIDIKLSITGDASLAMDHLRLMLVSPSGTFSELNNFRFDNFTTPFSLQALPYTDAIPILGDPGSVAPDGQFVWTFNTNRSWGERSDDAIIFDPTTGEPVIDTSGLFGDPNQPATIGEALRQGWQLVVENWGQGENFGLQGVEVAWHGSPIAANSQRVQGFVGVDDNRDDDFNYSRVIQTNLGTPGAIRLGDVSTTVDLTQESFAANALVTVRRTADNTLVDQFITGHDGNFYFDLVPDNYTITVEDSEGRLAKDDSLTPGGQLRHFKSEWQITTDYFRVWDHDPFAPAEVLTDANGDPLAWLDGSGATTTYGMKGINFLLDPGAIAPQQAEFTGTVYADVNGDGVFNGVDVNLPGVTVFGDLNRNGSLDPGEVTTITNAAGQYTLTVPITAGTVMNVGVVRLTNWASTNDGPATGDSKTDGLESFFVRPGDAVGNIVFAMQPPANNIGSGSQPGYLLGFVYDDANNNQSRQAGEGGAANMTVFVDKNNSGVPDAGDLITTTNVNGAFVFANVAPGQYIIRTVVGSPLVQTTPAPGTGRTITLAGASTFSDIQFGVRNTATLDFGDLPAIYGATLQGENGARHKKSAYWLGNTIDFELDGRPSANADGDDLFAPAMDEDGIVFDPIVPGSSAHIVVTASRAGGVLQGWVDWNNDGDFSDVGERILSDKALVAGANDVFFNVPAGANVNQVYARFRYGEHSLNGAKPIGTPFGEANLGEVEDYRLTVAVPALPQTQGMAADANQDGDVDGQDFLAWQRNLGRTGTPSQAQGDYNGDDRVNSFDLLDWRHSFGETAAAPQGVVAPSTGDFDGDSDVDGADFLALQRGVGLGFPSVGAGDGNHDGVVNGADVGLWMQAYGEQSTASAAALLPANSGSSSALASKSFTTASFVSAARVVESASSPLTVSVGVAAASINNAAFNFGNRPFTDLVRSLTAPEKTLRERVAAVREAADSVIADATAAWDHAADNFLHQDRAFADLIGSRRRQGLRVDGELDLAAAAADCDEAFASLADHFDWPRG